MSPRPIIAAVLVEKTACGPSDRHHPELKETIDHDRLADSKIVDRQNPTLKTTIPMLPSMLAEGITADAEDVPEAPVDRADMSAEQLAYYKIGAATEEKQMAKRILARIKADPVVFRDAVTGRAGHGRARKSQRCSSGGAAQAGEEIDQVITGETDERLQLRCRH